MGASPPRHSSLKREGWRGGVAPLRASAAASVLRTASRGSAPSRQLARCPSEVYLFWELDRDDDEALTLLLRVSEGAAIDQLCDVQANAELSLARLHEKLDFEETCRENLTQARRLIEWHGLEKLRPRLAVRLASYHDF